MFRTLQAQRDAGFRAAWFLWSDDKTADRIYNGAGFREVRRFALMRKELGGSPNDQTRMTSQWRSPNDEWPRAWARAAWPFVIH